MRDMRAGKGSAGCRGSVCGTAAEVAEVTELEREDEEMTADIQLVRAAHATAHAYTVRDGVKIFYRRQGRDMDTFVALSRVCRTEAEAWADAARTIREREERDAR